MLKIAMVQVPRGKIFQRKDAEAQSKKSNALALRALRLCGFALEVQFDRLAEYLQ